MFKLKMMTERPHLTALHFRVKAAESPPVEWKHCVLWWPYFHILRLSVFIYPKWFLWHLFFYCTWGSGRQFILCRFKNSCLCQIKLRKRWIIYLILEAFRNVTHPPLIFFLELITFLFIELFKKIISEECQNLRQVKKKSASCIN